jgi:hypothetical protein
VADYEIRGTKATTTKCQRPVPRFIITCSVQLQNKKDMQSLFKDPQGPIEEFSWGKFVIRGEVHEKNPGRKQGKGKDIYLMGDQVKKWKEREGHTLEPMMVRRVFDQNIDTLIIGLGVNGAIDCTKQTRKTIRENGIHELILLKTPEACRRYNQYYHQGKKVALLAHGTC